MYRTAGDFPEDEKVPYVDKGTYISFQIEQSDPRWLVLHDQPGRISGSVIFNALTGKYTPKQRLAQEMAGIVEEKPFTAEAMVLMAHGIKWEKHARNYYAGTRGVAVAQEGVAVPKWDRNLCGSPDGLVGDHGMIEIKCPKKLYRPLRGRLLSQARVDEAAAAGVVLEGLPECAGKITEQERKFLVSPRPYRHIKPEHFIQMQTYLAIYERDWIDYVVFCTDDRVVYVERVPRLPEYWKRVYTALKNFYCTYYFPLFAKPEKNLALPAKSVSGEDKPWNTRILNDRS